MVTDDDGRIVVFGGTLRTQLMLSLIVCLMLAAAACEDDDDGGSSDSSPTALPAGATATAASEGTRDDGAVESPEAALRRQIELLNSGDFGAEWDELHPGQQSVVKRELFIDCLAPNDFQLTLDIVETQDGVVSYPEVPQVPAKVITARLTSATETLERKLVEILVDGRWRWVLEQTQFDAYRTGACP